MTRSLWQGLDVFSCTPKELWDWLKHMQQGNNSVFVPGDPREVIARFREAFQCQRGGACCTREMSTKQQGIGITPAELQRLASLKNMTPEQFLIEFCAASETGIHMKYPCPFYKSESGHGVCTIHNERPLTCQIFPIDLAETPEAGIVAGIQTICPGGLIAAFKLLMQFRNERATG